MGIRDIGAAKEILKSLRLKVDQKWRNYFGEFVWLGPFFDRHGRRIGITECCFVDDPCAKHREVQP